MSTVSTTSDILRTTIEVMRTHGYEPVAEGECADVRRMAAALIGPDVASAKTLLAVRRLQSASCLAYRENGEITCVVGYLFLRQSALDDLMAGRFDALKLDVSRLSASNEAPALGYTWGIAGTSHVGARAAYAASAEMRQGAWRNIPFVTRAVTPVGRHIAITRGQFVPLRHPDDDLMIRRPAMDIAA
jgi:hypothetical protein